MGISSSIRALWSFLIAVSLCGVAFAQQSDYDPAYDDKEAAGTLNYNDNEAAGTLNYSDTQAAGGAPIDDEVPAESTALDDTASTESGLDMNPGAVAPRADEADKEARSERANRKPWEWGAPRHLSSLTGPTGLFYTLEAGSDEAGTFGVGIHGGYFKYKSFIYTGDSDVNMWGGLNLRVTPIKYLEIFTGLESRANFNSKGNPQLFQSLGDFSIGLKGNYSPIPGVTVGGIFALEFKNPVGEVDISGKGISFPLGLLTTFDITEFNDKIPVRAHLNFIYHFDRTANLVKDVEKFRGGCSVDIDGDGYLDYDGCLDPTERAGLDIDRTDQFRLGIGVDAMFPFISPLLEWTLDIPVNRQGFRCPRRGDMKVDSCIDVEGIGGMRQWMTFGIRVLPPIKTLTVDLGVDIGLTGYAPAVNESAPQAPYRILFGLTYNFDPFFSGYEPAPQPVLPPQPLPPPPPPPIIAGYVHDAASDQTPVPGAVVAYPGQVFNPQLSDASGRFRSYGMAVGRVSIVVSAEGYEEATFEVDIPDPSAGPPATDTGLDGAPPEATPVDPALENQGEAGTTPDADGTTPSDATAVTTPPDAASPGAPAASAMAVTSEPTIRYDESSGLMEITLDCPLKAKPKKGSLLVRATDASDKVLSGIPIKIEGPTPAEGVTDANGDVTFELDAGTYTIRAEKEGYFSKSKSIDVAVNTTMKVKMPISEKPKQSSAAISGKRINIKKRINFEKDSDEVKQDSFQLLDEVADILMTHPEIKLVEIQGHTDNQGKKSNNVELSQRRADSVRRYLVNAGVDASRLEAKGFGPASPIAPNITAAGRATNRRVEFHLKDKTE